MRELHELGDFPEVIFVTTYDKYAIEAFKYAAFDYLLKPVGLEDLKFTINRFRQKRRITADSQKINKLLSFLDKKERINLI
jgi:two-component system LytT family response regulator